MPPEAALVAEFSIATDSDDEESLLPTEFSQVPDESEAASNLSARRPAEVEEARSLMRRPFREPDKPVFRWQVVAASLLVVASLVIVVGAVSHPWVLRAAAFRESSTAVKDEVEDGAYDAFEDPDEGADEGAYDDSDDGDDESDEAEEADDNIDVYDDSDEGAYDGDYDYGYDGAHDDSDDGAYDVSDDGTDDDEGDEQYYDDDEGENDDDDDEGDDEDGADGGIEHAQDETLSRDEEAMLDGEAEGQIEPGFIFPGNSLRSVADVSSTDVCANLCAKDESCVAWSYSDVDGAPWSRTCYLRGSEPSDRLARIWDDEFVSGLPTHKGRDIDIYDPEPGQSLWCFVLFIPWSNEKDLLEYVYRQKTHIFTCEEYAVYSNGEYQVAPAVRTIKVDSDLHCNFGGEFGTALNTPIFFAVWDKVIEGGRFRKHDWTVKTDPDCVFFPDRLRGIVGKYQDYQGGSYLNNCPRGLHGPLEVFGKRAIESWANGRGACVQHLEQLCNGDCQWGEDIFIDQCLQFLGAYRIDDFAQLIEDHCDPPANWDSCADDRKYIAAFHPFKTPDAYAACWDTAQSPR